MRLQRSDSAMWRATPITLLVALENGQVLEVGMPAVDVWDLLAQPRALEDLPRQVGERLDVDAIDLVDSVTTIVERLVEAGCVHEAVR